MAFIKRTKKDLKTIPTDFQDMVDASDVLNFAERKGINTSPLDVSTLTQQLGIKMLLEPMEDDNSGSLKKDKKGEWVMKVNSLHHPNRQRFTIAHELGHFIKHSIQSDTFEDTTFFRNGESNTMEIEANKFAAELLMPKNDFDTFITNGASKVEDIAAHFQVSSMAVRIRAKQLAYTGHNL